HGDARERRRRPCGEPGIGFACLLECQVGGHGDVGVHARLNLGDTFEHRSGELHGGELARAELLVGFMRGEAPEVTHSSNARTRKNPSSCSGALASTSSCASDGATESSLMTFERGRGWAVGSMPSVFKAARAAKWSRMPESWRVNTSTSSSPRAIRASRAM